MKALKRTVVLMMSVLMLIATFSMAFTSSAASKKKVTKVKLNKTSITMYTTQTYTLKATISPSNASNKKVKWTTSNKNVATVSSSGKITAKKKGTATITCTAQDGSKKKATCKVTVTKKVNVKSVKLNNTSVQLKRGDKTTLKATISPSNASNKSVSWSSSNKNVAKVDSKGKVTAVANGTATITCKTKDKGKTATCKVTVSNTIKVTSVKLNKTAATLAKGKTLTLTATVSPSNATNKKVTWSSSNTKVATVNSSGKVTAVAAGTATITCKTNNNNKTATCKITVSPTKVTGISIAKTAFLYPGNSTKLTATIAPSNADNKTVKWTSSNSNVATVDSTGTVRAVAPGTVNITCTAQDGSKKSATCKVTVGTPVSDVKIKTTETSLNAWYVGKTSQLTAVIEPSNATNKTVTWKSDNEKVATVDANGNVKIVKYDTGVFGILANNKVTITATSVNGKVGEFHFTVIEEKIGVKGVTIDPEDNNGAVWVVGDKVKLVATIEPAEASENKVIFESSDPTKIYIDEDGVATALAETDSAYITVRSVDNKDAIDTLVISVKTPTLMIFDTAANPYEYYTVGDTLKASCYPDPPDLAKRGLVYEADDPEAVSITSNYSYSVYSNITFHKAGKIKIRVRTKDGIVVSDWLEVTVKEAKADRDFFENVKPGNEFDINVYSFDGTNKSKDIDFWCNNPFSEYIQLNDQQTKATIINELPDSGAYLEFTSIDGRLSCKIYFIKGTYKMPTTDAEKLQTMKDLSSAMKNSTDFTSNYSRYKDYSNIIVDNKKSSSDLKLNGMSLSTFLEFFGFIEEEDIMDDMSPEAFVKDMFAENETVNKNSISRSDCPTAITTDLSSVSGFVIKDYGSTYTIRMNLKNQNRAPLANISSSPYAKAMPVIDKAYLDSFVNDFKKIGGSLGSNDEFKIDEVSYGTVNETYSNGYVEYTIDKFTGKITESEYHYKSNFDVANSILNLTANISDTGNVLFDNLKITLNMNATFTLDFDDTIKMRNITY